MTNSSESLEQPRGGEPSMSRRALIGGAAGATLAASGALAQTGSAGTAARPRAGQVALVTGSSRGIGAATAKRLARDGYKVAVNCVEKRDLAAQVVRDIERDGGQAIWVQADVRDPRAVKQLFDASEKAFGPGLDVVVSNAGVLYNARIADITDAQIDHMIDVNTKGSLYVLREAARRVRDNGRIVTLSSSIVELRGPTFGAYAGTKASNWMYASILAKELGPRKVSVNAIAPGYVNTTLFTNGKTPEVIRDFISRTPMGRLGEPEDVAEMINVLCSPETAWVTGQVVFHNGGAV
jgi:3-oxoacyl-[acyl-carrier protein] reductase